MRRTQMTGVAATLAAALLATGCGGSGGSGLSSTQRIQTGTVCVDVAGSVATAAQVGLKAANGSLTQPQAAAQLAPIQQHVSDLASQNASLPLAADLTRLADSISKVQGLNSAAVADLQATGTQVTTATKDLLTACAAVRH